MRDSPLAYEALIRGYREIGDSLESTATKLGVVQILEMPMPVDGALMLDGRQRYVVKVSSACSRERRRFTLAHEIGHLILKDLFAASTSCRRDPELESACDSIAAELLMPLSMIGPFTANLGAASPTKLVQIAKRFGVSLRAAAYRVHHDLKLWSQPIGFWQFEEAAPSDEAGSGLESDYCPVERWFIGKREWKTNRPPFKVFFEALAAEGPVRRGETYFDTRDNVTKHPLLEVLHLGGKRLLGVVL